MMSGCRHFTARGCDQGYVRAEMFDMRHLGRKNGNVMRKWIFRWTRPIGWTLAVALAVALSANCVTGEEMTPAQMACCAAMGHDCGAMAQKADCCSHESPRVAQFFAAVKGTVLAVPVLLATPVALLPATAPQGLRTHVTHVPLKPNRVPKYLRTAALLI